MPDLSPLSNLLTAGCPLTIVIAAYYAIKAVVYLAAGIVAMHTEEDKRRDACLEMMRITSLTWPRPSRRRGVLK
jgi:hypothetical protein